MLKHTGSEVELLWDENMYMFFEEGCRGGVSMACKRFCKANNKYLGKTYDPKEEEVHILYHDANALYGGCLMRPLPYKDFKWIGKTELEKMEKDHTLIRGCTLEVDLDVPKDHAFHDHTSCFPLAPEHKVVEGVTKLVPNLLDKRCYIVHHSALQTYLKHGLILRKIYRGVSYREEFIRPYIELCTKKRQASKTDFESGLWKLYANAVFGTQMENVRARSGVVLVSGETEKGKKRLRTLVASPTFRGATIFANSSLTSVTRANPRVWLNKPIQVGQAVLDMSKSVMYEHWYGIVKPLWGNRVMMSGMDTDGILMEIRGSDPYVDITPLVSNHFDTSSFKKPHPSGMPIGVNKKVPLLFKDEMGDNPIYKVVFLAPKAYSISHMEGETKKLKGVPKMVVRKSINHDLYKKCELEEMNYDCHFYTLRSRDHREHTELVTKRALRRTDTKRWNPDDGTHKTWPWGSYRIPKDQQLVR